MADATLYHFFLYTYVYYWLKSNANDDNGNEKKPFLYVRDVIKTRIR